LTGSISIVNYSEHAEPIEAALIRITRIITAIK